MNKLPVLLTGLAAASAVALIASQRSAGQDTRNFPAIGKILRDDPQLDSLIPREAKIEVVASGFVWSEGPVWVREGRLRLSMAMRSFMASRETGGQAQPSGAGARAMCVLIRAWA